MPYALFANNEQISKAYQTEHEVWKKADEAGLVVDVTSDDEKQAPKRVLDEDYHIRSCPANIDRERADDIQTAPRFIEADRKHAGVKR